MVDLFRQSATPADMREAGFLVFGKDEDGMIVVDSHEHIITRREDGWYVRLLFTSQQRETWLRHLGWADAPREVF